MSSSNPYGMDRRAGGSGNPGGSGAGGGGGNGPPGGGNFPSNDFFFAQDTNRQILLILLRLQQDTNNVLTRLNYLESSVISLQVTNRIAISRNNHLTVMFHYLYSCFLFKE